MPRTLFRQTAGETVFVAHEKIAGNCINAVGIVNAERGVIAGCMLGVANYSAEHEF